MTTTLIIIGIIVAFFGMCFIASSIQKRKKDAELNAPTSSDVEDDEDEDENENDEKGDSSSILGCLILWILFGVGLWTLGDFMYNRFTEKKVMNMDTPVAEVIAVNNNGCQIVAKNLSNGKLDTITVTRHLRPESNWQSAEKESYKETKRYFDGGVLVTRYNDKDEVGYLKVETIPDGAVFIAHSKDGSIQSSRRDTLSINKDEVAYWGTETIPGGAVFIAHFNDGSIRRDTVQVRETYTEDGGVFFETTIKNGSNTHYSAHHMKRAIKPNTNWESVK